VFQYFFDAIGWRQTAFWYGVFALATMLPLVFILRQKPPQPEAAAPAVPATPAAPLAPDHPSALPLARQTVPPRWAPVPSRIMQTSLSVASIGCCVGMSLPLAHVVSHVSDIGYAPARGAEVLSLMLASAAVSSFFGVGFLGGRYGGLRALFVFSSTQAIFLAVLAFVDSLTAVYIAAMLFGLGYGGILPCYPIIVREHLPAPEVGRRTGLVILFAGGGMALGAWLGGAIFDLTGSYKLAFLIGVAFNLANLAIIGSLISRTRVRPVLA
jgi:MFS family permease